MKMANPTPRNIYLSVCNYKNVLKYTEDGAVSFCASEFGRSKDFIREVYAREAEYAARV
jgi:hypothetical protein